ncbi:hypothetical protein BLOT_007919 [Blomia tropicalis]|nr:hypothetical protein BLOT_007919 [Blomia tropicalis]
MITSCIRSFNVDHPSNQVNSLHFKSKLIEQIKLSNEQANFVLLKYFNYNNNEQQSIENDHEITEKINLIQACFKHVDICHNLDLFSLPLNELQNRINILKEVGFIHLEINLINSIPLLMSKTLADLKQCGFYPTDGNPFLRILQFLVSKQLMTQNESEIMGQESKWINDIDQYQLCEIRSRCLTFVLRTLLDCSEHVAAHIIENYNSSRGFDNISFTQLITNLNIIIEEVKLPINQLIKYFNILANQEPEKLKQLANISIFKENNNLRYTFFTRQRLLQIKPHHIKERVDLLVKKYKCTGQQLNETIAILDLPAEEIEELFSKYNQCDQLKTFSNNKHFLRLIMNIDLALNNVKNMDERKISTRHTTLRNLLKPNSKFMSMVKNSTFRLTLNSFTQLHFDSSLKDVKHRIGWNKMGKQSLNSINAESIVSYFRQERLSDQQIQNGLYLIYCPFETVKTVWEEMFDYDEVRRSNIDWRNHPYVLQLLFHFIERMNRH